MKFRIDYDVTQASGSQTYEVEAETKEDALKMFLDGDDKYISGEVNAENLSTPTLEEIYEPD